jgi:hypothetical protein
MKPISTFSESPSAPWACGFGVDAVVPVGTIPDALFPPTRELGVLAAEVWRRRHEIDPDQPREVTLVRLDPSAKSRAKSWPDGVVDEATWSAAIEDVGTKWELIHLGGGGFYIRLMNVGDKATLRANTGGIDLDDADADALAAEMLAVLRRAASGPGVVTGYVHVDSSPDPYGHLVRGFANLDLYGPPHPVAGYYWALLLGPDQVEDLGGVGRVEREAPVWKVESLAAGACLCVLTERPSQITAASMLAWREFLQPVLTPGYAGPRRTGKQIRLRPAWIFEGALIPIFARVALERVVDGPRAPTVEISDGHGEEVCVSYSVPVGPGEVRDTAVSVVRAWAVQGSGYGFNMPRVTLTVLSEPDLDGDIVRTRISIPPEILHQAIATLAAALSAVAVELDPDGSGPFGSLTVGPCSPTTSPTPGS